MKYISSGDMQQLIAVLNKEFPGESLHNIGVGLIVMYLLTLDSQEQENPLTYKDKMNSYIDKIQRMIVTSYQATLMQMAINRTDSVN